jgi:hypothetical protein
MTTETLSLIALLARSARLHAAWQEALSQPPLDEDSEISMRELLSLNACALALEHGEAIRELLAKGLESSALTLLRVQHEALLRAVWICFAASDNEVLALGAPHTMATLKKANSLPLTGALLEQVMKSDAPVPLKRGLREFRDESWAGVNSYAHSGLLALGRVSSGHPEAHLVQALQVSNAHSYATCMVMAMIDGPEHAAASISVIAQAHPGCMALAKSVDQK